LTKFRKRIHNAPDNVTPTAGRFLPEQAHRWVPRRILSFQHPSPIGHCGQQNPNGFAHSSGKMRCCGVDGDHEIEIGHYRGSVSKIVKIGG
jgi:hypothetical protein